MTATTTPTSDYISSTHLDPLASSFVPRFVSTSPPTTLPPPTVVRPPINPDPIPSAVDNVVPVVGEFELDEETQLKVEKPSPDQTEFELTEHVNVLFLQTIEGVDLPDESVQGLKLLLRNHQDTFASSSMDLGFCPLVKYDIDTGDARPIKQSPRRPPIAAREAEDEILNEMLEKGVIEPSNSSWASPVCLVKKKDGTFRFCIDYRRVNAVSKKDAYPIPDIQDALDNLRGSRCFATIDLLVVTGN